MNIWENLIIHALLGVLQMVIKDPQKQSELCQTLLQIRDTITEMYPNGCPGSNG